MLFNAYNEEGRLVPLRRVSLPSQAIERVRKTRATRAQRPERLLVMLIHIFGTDTSQVFEVEVA